MASRGSSMNHDRNLNIHINESSTGWKTSVSKASKKGGDGGRKPLGDLSNSIKPYLIHALKKQSSTITSFPGKEQDCSQVGLSDSSAAIISLKQNSTIISAADKEHGYSHVDGSKKKASTGARKALSDISNSVKPHATETSKNRSDVTKLSAVAEEATDVEPFEHDHRECVKDQKKAMDLDQFLQIIGLPKENQNSDISKAAPSCPASTHDDIIELEEMPEIIDVQFCTNMLSCLPVSPSFRTSPSRDHCVGSLYQDYDFKLVGSP